MNNGLSPLQIVGWLRQQSVKLSEMADELEITFGILNKHAGNEPNCSASTQSVTRAAGNSAVLQKAIEHLRDRKARRVAEIASAIGETQKIVTRLIDGNPSTFERRDRGWVVLRNDVLVAEGAIGEN